MPEANAMTNEESEAIKNKMLELLYRDSDGDINHYSDMIEIGMELKFDEETAKSFAMQLHSQGLIQLVDPWAFDASLTENGLAKLKGLFIGTTREMRSLQADNPGLRKFKTATPDRPRKAIPGKVILVVDDDVDMLGAMKHILNGMGYVVDTATNGEAGVAKAIAIRPAIIFLDYNMPGGDGVGVYEQLHVKQETTEVPVVFLTSVPPEQLSSRIASPRPDTFYLQKPVPLALLRDIIRQLLPQ